MLGIKNTVLLVFLIFLEHKGLCGQEISDSWLFKWFKIILKVCFNSAVKNVLVYEYTCWYNSEIMFA